MIGVPTLIFWVIGMPLFIFVVLESHRKSKHNDVIRFRFGMLMEGYEGKCRGGGCKKFFRGVLLD